MLAMPRRSPHSMRSHTMRLLTTSATTYLLFCCLLFHLHVTNGHAQQQTSIASARYRVASSFPGADIREQAENALASFGPDECGEVYIPSGTYRYRSVLHVPSGCTVSGAGPLATVLVYEGPAATPAVAMMNLDMSPASSVTLKDFSLRSAAGTCPNGGTLTWLTDSRSWKCYDGVQRSEAIPHLAAILHGQADPTLLGFGTRNMIDNVRVNGFTPAAPTAAQGAFHFGIWLNGCKNCTVRSTTSEGADDGIFMGPSMEDSELLQAKAQFNRRSGFHYRGQNSFRCYACAAESNHPSDGTDSSGSDGAGLLASAQYAAGPASGAQFVSTLYRDNGTDLVSSADTTMEGSFDGFRSARGRFGTATFTECSIPEASRVSTSDSAQLTVGCKVVGLFNTSGTNAVIRYTDETGATVKQVLRPDTNAVQPMAERAEAATPPTLLHSVSASKLSEAALRWTEEVSSQRRAFQSDVADIGKGPKVVVSRWQSLISALPADATSSDAIRQIANVVTSRANALAVTPVDASPTNGSVPYVVATDFPGSDIGEKVNRAFASFGPGLCGTVIVPANVYNYTTTIYVPGSCVLAGVGKGDPTVSSAPKATRLVYKGAPATSAIVLGVNDSTPSSDTVVRDLSVSSGLTSTCPGGGMLRWNNSATGSNKWQCWDGSRWSPAVAHLAGIRHGSLDPRELHDGTFNSIINVNVDGSGLNWPTTYGAFHFAVMLNGCEECLLEAVSVSGADDGFALGPATNGVLFNAIFARINKRSGLAQHFWSNYVCNLCLFESNGMLAPSSDPTKYGQGIRLADDDSGYGPGIGGVFYAPYFENNLVDVFVPEGQNGSTTIEHAMANMSIRGAVSGVFQGGCGGLNPALITIAGKTELACSTPLPNLNFVFLPGAELVLTDPNRSMPRKVIAWSTSGKTGTLYEYTDDHNLYIRNEGPYSTDGLRLDNAGAATARDNTLPSATLRLIGKLWNGQTSVDKMWQIDSFPYGNVSRFRLLEAGTTERLTVLEDGIVQFLPSASGNLRLQIVPKVGQTGNQQEWGDGKTVTSFVDPTGALAVRPSGPKPLCDGAKRFVFWTTVGSAGVKDTIEVCAQDANGVFAWRILF